MLKYLLLNIKQQLSLFYLKQTPIPNEWIVITYFIWKLHTEKEKKNQLNEFSLRYDEDKIAGPHKKEERNVCKVFLY